ncbi:hypothetical protein [Parafrankia elaeagni]|uniref:hypothetical protein n=1 Tax=Parafrankia elaeagni TaxID=222534 RepID=UPI0003A25027|nr:hypothetical protein [Parafrankia elaeagni]
MAVGDEGKIEDVVREVFGHTLGAGSTGGQGAATPGGGGQQAGPGGVLDTQLRPDTIRSAGPPWLIAEPHDEEYKVSGSSKPALIENSIVFWRWMTNDWSSNIEWVRVWFGAKDGGSTGSSSNPPQADGTNPLQKIGSAWENLRVMLQALAGGGPESVFDVRTLEGVSLALQGIAAFAQTVYDGLSVDITGIDTKSVEFSGSAAQAFRNRVWEARRGVVDLAREIKKWELPLQDSLASARAFLTQLDLDLRYWQGEQVDARPLPAGEPKGVWVQPYLLLAAMFNGANVFDTYDPTNRNASGGLWEAKHIRGARGLHEGNVGFDDIWGEMYIRFPEWSGVVGDFPVLREPSWVAIDQAVRTNWANRVQNSFAPTLEKAKKMRAEFARTASLIRLPAMPPSRPAGPPGSGAPGSGDLGDFLEDLNENMGAGFKGLNENMGLGLGDLASGIGKGLGGLNDNLGDGFGSLGGLGAGGGLGGLGGGGGLGGLEGGLGGGGGLGGLEGGLGGGGVGGALGPVLGGGGVGGLGGLGGGTGGQSGTGTGFGGLGGGSLGRPSSLGDLTPAQLGELADAGLLDSHPLTPAQAEALREAGFDTDGLRNLGDLTPEQLGTLQRAGLLDGLPLGGADLEALRDAGLLPPGTSGLGGGPEVPRFGGGGLGGLPGPTPSTQFPTRIDGLDVTPVSPGGAGSGTAVGDIRQPMARSVGSAGGGFGTAGVNLPGTEGLIIPGVGTGPAAGGTGAAAAGQAGGMPFMPMPMGMGGGAPMGGGGQSRERQRNTWLTEDEEVWGTDPVCGPAVVGREDTPTQDDSPYRDPALPTPAPGRGGRVRRR